MPAHPRTQRSGAAYSSGGRGRRRRRRMGRLIKSNSCIAAGWRTSRRSGAIGGGARWRGAGRGWTATG
eukprot:8296825-Pyramimonas_sp.AAC.1